MADVVSSDVREVGGRLLHKANAHVLLGRVGTMRVQTLSGCGTSWPERLAQFVKGATLNGATADDAPLVTLCLHSDHKLVVDAQRSYAEYL